LIERITRDSNGKTADGNEVRAYISTEAIYLARISSVFRCCCSSSSSFLLRWP